MARTAKILLWLVALPIAAVFFVTPLGIAEPYLSPSDIPLEPFQSILTAFGFLIAAIVLSSVLNILAWRKTGNAAGLRPDGTIALFSKPPGGSRKLVGSPDLVGTVLGRAVRARTYKTGGGRHSSSTRYTVVETELETPVDWRAMMAPAVEEEMESMGDVGASQWTVIDDEVAIWGDLSEAEAREVLSSRARNALKGVEGGVTVGDVKQLALTQMAGAIPDGADSASANMAKGVLNMAGAGDAGGPSRRVVHREEGLLLDHEHLQRRAEAVSIVAESIERTSR